MYDDYEKKAKETIHDMKKAKESNVAVLNELEHYLKNESDPKTKEKYNKLIEHHKENVKILDNFLDTFNRIQKKKVRRNTIEMEILDSIRPDKYIIPNNKLSNSLTDVKTPFNNSEFMLEVNKKKNIKNPVTINYEDDNIQITNKEKRFTPYDRVVHNAICSLFEAGNSNFTPIQVYRAMNGLPNSYRPSPQAIGAVTKSIDKMTNIKTTIDFTDEAKKHNYEVDKTEVEENILLASKIFVKAGGHETTGYKLYKKPLLYEYAQISKQVLTVPIELINTSQVINSTPENIVIREFLIRRIERMKHNNDGNKILLKAIYDEIGHEEPSRKKAMKVRDTASLLLDKFKKDKYIKKHIFYKKGRTIAGIEIIY